jgi:seryl-tRNA synthetase
MSALVSQDDADKLQNLYKEIGNMAKAGEDTSAVKGKINELIESMKRLGTEGANAAETAGNSLRSLGTDGENALNELDADVDELVDNARDIGHQQG